MLGRCLLVPTHTREWEVHLVLWMVPGFQLLGVQWTEHLVGVDCSSLVLVAALRL